MKIDGKHYRTLWPDEAAGIVHVIDQTRLPHRFEICVLRGCAEAESAIADMIVRGAPLIGVTGAYGMALAMGEDASDLGLQGAYARLLATRPTASNLKWALDRQFAVLRAAAPAERRARAWAEAAAIAEEDVAMCEAIGAHGAAVIGDLAARKGGARLNILTHCNAGWLATVDWGTALAPIYKAVRAGVDLHVWVDETRPRNQGASLTAFELAGEGVPFSVIADNAGGHLMQHGLVDLCIVGSDRTTRTGDVCNKIGTYLKALAAHDNRVPFYAALPSSTLDWSMRDGVREIPIEERSAREVTHIAGRASDGATVEVQLTPDAANARNFAFDVTPARYVTGIITERGVHGASEAALVAAFPAESAR
ncbi:MAG: S-methyl-5-thioribose-1-phosphate isomerase [Hyphomicrobiales bacterium]|nr:S-methyl-5-thioribose-1-phosphate isomerase [Hyphomicrobiales bacterium]